MVIISTTTNGSEIMARGGDDTIHVNPTVYYIIQLISIVFINACGITS